MKLEFDILGGALSVVEGAEKGDRAIAVILKGGQAEGVRVTVSTKLGGRIVPTDWAVAVKNGDSFIAAFEGGVFWDSAVYIVTVSLTAKVQLAGGEWFACQKSAIIEVEAGSEAVEGSITQLSLQKNGAAALSAIEAEQKTVAFACDSVGDIWKITHDGSSQSRVNLSSMLKEKPSTDEISLMISQKADKSYVDTELNKKATTASVNAKADRTELESFAISITTKANTSYVNTELAKKADKESTETEIAKKADITYVDEQIAASGGGIKAVLYDAASSSQNLGYPNGMVNGTTAVISFGLFKEVDIFWRADNKNANYLTKTTLFIATSGESYVSDVTFSPDELTTPVKLYGGSFHIDNTKKVLTVKFYSFNLSTGASTADTKSCIRKIIAYR